MFIHFKDEEFVIFGKDLELMKIGEELVQQYLKK